VRIVDYDALPARLELGRLALTQAAFSAVVDRATVRRLRILSSAPAPYFGLYAVEGNELVGELTVLRLRYRRPSSEVPVCGIANVTTRYDRRRRGIGAALLQEAHRREAKAGARYSLLWTSPGWHAHELYERLGYRDVYRSALAVRELASRSSGPGPRLRSATPQDFDVLERLHRAFARDRLGFVTRSAGALAVEADLGWFDLTAVRVLEVAGEVVGYALATKGPRQRRCGEFVAPVQHRAALLRALEREATPGTQVFANTPVTDLRRELRARRYLTGAGLEWRALMAARLGPAEPAGPLTSELGTDRPRFLCMTMDRF
jgi:predicted N-acetyltransferase YhbS